jgi:hypothetical protein
MITATIFVSPRPIEVMQRPFEGDRFLHAEVMRLCARYRVQTIIETGTQHGVTTAAMAEFAPRVLTVEYMPGYRALAHKPNIEQFIGDSGEVIRSLILLAQQPILFYLDAHDDNNSPLLQELESIATNVRDQIIREPLIIIHDFQLLNHPERGFDSIHGQPLNWQYVEGAVQRIYPNPITYALPQSEGARRGALFIVPEAVND